MYYTKKPRQFLFRNPGSALQNRSRMIKWMEQMELKNNKDIAALETEIRRLKKALASKISRLEEKK